MNEWVWSIGRKILTGKNQTLPAKPGPVPLCPPQIPYRLAYKWTWASVVRGPGLTNRAIYLLWEKWPKNAFSCIDRSRCVALHVACFTNTGSVLFERLCNRNCTQLFSLKLATYAKYCISNIWTSFFNIKYPSCWLRNSLSHLMGMVSVLLEFHVFMYLRHMAKFRIKLVACYMCHKACQKSCITTEVSCPVGQNEP